MSIWHNDLYAHGILHTISGVVLGFYYSEQMCLLCPKAKWARFFVSDVPKSIKCELKLSDLSNRKLLFYSHF